LIITLIKAEWVYGGMTRRALDVAFADAD